MKIDSSQKLMPDSSQEVWLSKKEIKALFPVADRTLRYWRNKKKVRFKIVKKDSYYLEREIRVLMENRAQPQKKIPLHKRIRRKLLKADRFYILAIGALIPGLFYLKPGSKNKVYTTWEVYRPIVYFLCLAFIYGVVRWIIFYRKENIRKRGLSDDAVQPLKKTS
jgi:hypothetical protein